MDILFYLWSKISYNEERSKFPFIMADTIIVKDS